MATGGELIRSPLPLPPFQTCWYWYTGSGTVDGMTAGDNIRRRLILPTKRGVTGDATSRQL